MPASTASLSNYNQRYLAEDGIEHAAGVPAGLAGARQVVASYFTDFPDLHLTIEAVLAATASCWRGSAPRARTRVSSLGVVAT